MATKNNYTIAKATYHFNNLFRPESYDETKVEYPCTLKFASVNELATCDWDGRYKDLSGEEYITSLVLSFLNKNADNDAHGRYGEDYKFSIDDLKFIPNNLSERDYVLELNQAREEGYKAVVLSKGGDFKNTTLLENPVHVILLEKGKVYAPYYAFQFAHEELAV